MTNLIRSYAAYSNDAKLSTFEYSPRPLGEHDVHIKISHCSVCASDIHTLTSGWGKTD
jgi:alcohol dehydrogenase (NADP+)